MSDETKAVNSVDRANHWIAAIVIISLLAAGWGLYFEAFAQDTGHGIRDLHKSFGTLILAFGLWRVTYRLIRGFPEPVAAMRPAQQFAARITHYLLLAFIIIMPASGLCKSLFGGRPIDMFGLFTIGTADMKNETIGELASNVHFVAGVAITLILALHIAAAIKHHFVDRDATLVRMLRK